MKILPIILLLFAGSCAIIKPAESNLSNYNQLFINRLIKKFEAEDKQNPARTIFSFQFNNNTEFYVSAPCCTQFSDLYDSNCALIGHPDGGVSGIGDGLLMDFQGKRSKGKLIWKDAR